MVLPMGVTIVDLYRSGNANGPRLANLRLKDTRPLDPDIDTELDGSGTEMVKSASGGVSLWERRDKNWSKVWKLPNGTVYPSELTIWCDNSPHWLVSPARDMALAQYVRALAALGNAFVLIN